MSAGAFRYGEWHGGRDPLEPPYDVASALDEIGERVLAGDSPRQALRDLLRPGADGLRGLDDLRRQVAKRQRQARRQGPARRHARGGPRAAREGRRAGEAGAVPRPVGRRADGRDGARHAAARHRPRGAGARAVRVAQPRGAGGVRADRRPAAPRGARQPVQGDEAGPGVRDAGGDAGRQGHARRPQPRCSRPTRAARTPPQQFADFMAAARRVLPERPAVARGARRRPRPARGGAAAADGLAHAAAAPGARRAHAGRDGRRPAPRRWPSSATACATPARTCRGAAASRCAASRAWGWARGPARSRSSPTSTSSRPRSARTTRAPRSTTSTRPPCSARSAAARSTTSRRCAASSASCRRRATSSATSRAGSSCRPRAVRRLGATALRKVFSDLSSKGRGGHDVRDAGAAGDTHRRLPGLGVRRRAAARRRAHRPQRRARGRRPGRRPAARRRLRGGRDRAADHRGGRAAGRPVVLDGAARHLGRGQADRARAALAGHDAVPAGRDRGHRLQRHGAGAAARAARRARRAAGAGHQPAARADAGRPVPRQAPRRRAGRAGRHRRRADRAPDPRRLGGVLLAAAAGDARADDGRGRADHPPRRDDQRLHARRRAAPGRLRRGDRAPATAAGSSPPTPTRLGEYVVSDYLRARRGRRG